MNMRLVEQKALEKCLGIFFDIESFIVYSV